MGTKITLPTAAEVNHWWDGLTPFDDFTGINGAAPDAGKWDTAVGDNGNGTTTHTVNIQSNDCRITAYGQSTFDNITTSYAQLSLKTALTSGRIIALITSLTLAVVGDADDSVKCEYSVGNATDGWTEVEEGNNSHGGTSSQPTASLEAIYIGGNDWNVYIGNTPYAGNPVTLANGLKIRFYVYVSVDDTGDNATGTLNVMEVYID